jgi:hypothetical protein
MAIISCLNIWNKLDIKWDLKYYITPIPISLIDKLEQVSKKNPYSNSYSKSKILLKYSKIYKPIFKIN